MSLRILKWEVPSFGAAEITTTGEPRWLAAGWQDEVVVAWCQAVISGVGLPVRTRLFAVMTGQEVPREAVYVGTAQHPTLLNGGPFVVHVYAQVVP